MIPNIEFFFSNHLFIFNYSADMDKSFNSAYAQLKVTGGVVIPDGANTVEPSSNDANANRANLD